MRPSPSVVSVGYQRGCSIRRTRIQRWSSGSNTSASRMPRNGPYCPVPPAASSRPPSRNDCPAQKRSIGVRGELKRRLG